MKLIRNKVVNALFLATDQQDRCAVWRLYARLGKAKWNLKDVFNPHPRRYLLNKFYVSYEGFIQAHNLPNTQLDKIVVFGIKEESYPVLLSPEKKFIYYYWFNYKIRPAISIFFVSGSASLLKEYSEWTNSFPSWVAFERFDFLVGLSPGDQIAAMLYPQLFDAISRCGSAKEIHHEFNRIYWAAVEELATKDVENYDDLSLTVMKLLTNKNNLEYQ